MEQLFIIIALGLFGVILGSYAAATVWRLRAKQLVQDKADGEKVDAKEYKKLLPLTKATLRTDRSRCLHCGHTLAWYDLLPLASWLGLKGKCRYCHTSIGYFEPMMEVGMAAFFIGLYIFWPVPLDSTLQIATFIAWLIAAVMLVILFAYDLRWFLLPDQVTIPLIGLSVLISALHVLGAPDAIAALINVAIAVVILSGVYLALWLYSKGRWIGFGDVKLGLALALLLSDWQLAFLALFGANLLGCLIVIPGMISGKMTRTSKVPFGPLLIAGMVIAFLWGEQVITGYQQLILSAV